MATMLDRSTILIPVDVADPDTPPAALVELLQPHQLVILSYYRVPDQTPIEQAEEELGDEARETVEEVVSQFEGDTDVTSTVVFTRGRSTTLDRVVREYDADAVLTPGDMGESLNDVLVPLKGDPNIVHIVEFTGLLLGNSDAAVTVFHVADSDEDEARSEFLLRGACDRLREFGIEADRVGWKQVRSGSPGNAIVSEAEDYDLLVVGESEPSLRRRILGTVTRSVNDRTSSPTLVVRSK
ncbi:universal stress protein [Natronoarchaeum sp. GCM10025321]|uniref:universal stress protein n=1 Tax=Natronoarchaeum sp. GCM10025321 TaxID=3252684 RepID=UPI003612EC6E